IPTWPELPRPQNTTMRGLACSIRAAIAEMASVRARRRAAAAGISAISRPIALPVCGSAIAARGFFDGCAQIAAMAFEQLRRLVVIQSQADQYSGLNIAFCVLEMAGSFALRTADDLADHRLGAPTQLGVSRPHIDHHPAVDAAELYHHGSREQVQHDFVRGACFHPG